MVKKSLGKGKENFISENRKTEKYLKNQKFKNPKIIEIYKIRGLNENVKNQIKIIPKSINQEKYLLELEDESKPIVVAVGPAGTGKTLLATLWAIKGLRSKKFSKIVISRPNIAVDDKDIGFLPGDILKKMTPWMLPILDIFKEYYSISELEDMLKNEIIEICPIAYIRGRTFKNSVVIIDEAQGTTPNSMLSILTRIGEGSKMIITGDIKQTDRGGDNGLQIFIDKIKSREGTKHISLVEFNERDIERHPAVREILELFKDVKI
ncbi:MAG: PhoH family protein [Candidatus Aenigmatarchaeota archaeon]